VFRHLVDTGGSCLLQLEEGGGESRRGGDGGAEHRDDYLRRRDDFLLHLRNHGRRREKVLVLYGYNCCCDGDDADDDDDESTATTIRHGDDAARVLLRALRLQERQQQQMGSTNSFVSSDDDAASESANRSYGNAARATPIVRQDDGTGAVTEVLATWLAPLETSSLVAAATTTTKSDDAGGDHEDQQQWIDRVNATIRDIMLGTAVATTERHHHHHHHQLRVLGRIALPAWASRFGAETDASHRRVEYLLPADFLYAAPDRGREFFDALPSFADGCYGPGSANRGGGDDNGGFVDKEETNGGNSSAGQRRRRRQQVHNPKSVTESPQRPDQDGIRYLFELKKIMQSLTTQHVDVGVVRDSGRAVLETHQPEKKDVGDGVDRRDDEKKDNAVGNGSTTNGTTTATTKKKKKKRVLRRKRYHNFTPTVMAHEYLSFRRLDRFYHKSTLRFASKVDDCGRRRATLLAPGCGRSGDLTTKNERAFIVLSFTGDQFLTGQVSRMVGLFVALARGVIDRDIVECAFDEEYPHLIPMPPAPPFAAYAAEAQYDKWEGKLRTVLTPRVCDNFDSGWNDAATLERVRQWQTTLREQIVDRWLRDGIDGDDRLVAEHKFTNEVLEPWVERARGHLASYRAWKSAASAPCTKANPAKNVGVVLLGPSTSSTTTDRDSVPFMSPLPHIESVDRTVPPLFEKVLSCLREIDRDGRWPSTTPKRQLVMVSTLEDKQPETNGNSNASSSSLSVAGMRAKSNNRKSKSSAYVYKEGHGGASGSFSVGAMPGDQCIQPKANTHFPELMKAAFELEMLLFPNRQPSSTIAINRNAQFRPHTDSGAGAGQVRIFELL